ncbi:MAG: glucosaminidase domain-containing protein [Erysipelotrichaceae bacterium]|nr:glucosaminidase domain-containing protein [Erysipelotrichaceae bacterium]
MKKLMLILFFLMNLFITVHAENEQYDVIHTSDHSVIASFGDYSEAVELMNENIDYAVIYKDQMIAMHEGVVVLDHNQCTVNIDVIYEKTDEHGYINGCYGNDGLYLQTNSTGKWILMLQSGAKVWVHRDDITLVPYSDDLLLSSYFVKGDHLYHQIRTRWNTNEYGSLIDLGPAPEQLNEDIMYFSYDGHSFYDDFRFMSQDMKSENDNHAVNSNSPYYNYFMMLPHRSYSSITLNEVNELFTSMKMTSKPVFYLDENQDSINDILTCSQYVNSLDSFLYTQSEYGTNALLMLSLSINESASGRSSLAYRRNNLFGHAAFDSDVEGNARRYLNVESSVISHAKNYISLSYANPEKFTYHGSFFGDKSCGMNVSYASDPYWSEKAAQYAYELDEKLGGKDYNSEALAIVKDEKDIIIFDETLDDGLAAIENQTTMSFVILDEIDDYYLVQIDESIYGFENQKGSYDFRLNTGYLEKSIVDIVLNEKMIHQSEFDFILFDADTGVFKDGNNTKMLQFKIGSEIICETPVKEHAVFERWNQLTDNTYQAQYREIDHIEMGQMPPQIVELNVPLDLSNGSIQVIYKNGDTEVIPLTMSMVQGYDLSNAGEQIVTVTYGGSSCSYPLVVSENLDIVRKEIMSLVERVLSYDIETERTEEEIQTLKYLNDLLIDEFYPVFTMKQITALDKVYETLLRDNYSVIIKENEYDLAVSGLFFANNFDLSTADIFKDTIHLSILPAKSPDLLKETAVSQGWEIVDGFTLEMSLNRNKTAWKGPMIFSIARPLEKNKTYSVLYLSNDDVIHCHTSLYLDRIRFKALEPGEYLLVSKDTVNEYNNLAPVEVFTYKHNGLDYDLLIKSGSFVSIIVLIFLIGIVLNLKSKFRK